MEDNIVDKLLKVIMELSEKIGGLKKENEELRKRLGITEYKKNDIKEALELRKKLVKVRSLF